MSECKTELSNAHKAAWCLTHASLLETCLKAKLAAEEVAHSNNLRDADGKIRSAEKRLADAEKRFNAVCDHLGAPTRDEAGIIAVAKQAVSDANALTAAEKELAPLREIAEAVEQRIGLNVTRAWVYGDHDSMREIALAVAKWRGVEQIAP